MHQFAPNFNELSNETKIKVHALKDQVDVEMKMSEKVPEWFEILNIELIRKKIMFKQYYSDVGLLQEVAISDKEF